MIVLSNPHKGRRSSRRRSKRSNPRKGRSHARKGGIMSLLYGVKRKMSRNSLGHHSWVPAYAGMANPSATASYSKAVTSPRTYSIAFPIIAGALGNLGLSKAAERMMPPSWSDTKLKQAVIGTGTSFLLLAGSALFAKKYSAAIFYGALFETLTAATLPYFAKIDEMISPTPAPSPNKMAGMGNHNWAPEYAHGDSYDAPVEID